MSPLTSNEVEEDISRLFFFSLVVFGGCPKAHIQSIDIYPQQTITFYMLAGDV